MTDSQLRTFLKEMTLKEKIGQLVQLSAEFFGTGDMATGPMEALGIEPWVVEHAGSALNVLGAQRIRELQRRHLEKSRIPLLIMADIIYGYRTVYPIPLGMAAGWNPELVRHCCRLTAREALPDGAHVTFAPMVDVVRDARWGRCMESPGEDPWLNGIYARAIVEGFQSQGLSSCVKHFAAYGAAEGGRDYNTVDMSRWRLMQEYLMPYRAAVEAGCDMVMTSFNTVEGMPATGNKWLMDDVLRKMWGFDGILITDYAAIHELVVHGVAEDAAEAAELAMKAGVDIDMRSACYANQLEPLLTDGRLDPEKLDEAVLRVLRLKNKLGLFEDPYAGIDEEEAARRAVCAQNREAAREAARNSLVLLKNEHETLPVRKDLRIALMGPYADSRDITGMWAIHRDRTQVVTLKTAFEEVLDADHFASAQGCQMLEHYKSLGFFAGIDPVGDKGIDAGAELARSIELARWADVVVFAVGEHTLQSGESGSRTDLTIPAIQRKWMDAVLPHAKKSVALVFSGRPLVLTELEPKVDAMIQCWFPGTEGGHAVADILFGHAGPSGRLTVSFPYAVGQIPIYYSAFRTGRPVTPENRGMRFVSSYLDCPNEPLYPFGYGLGYHKAVYGDVSLSAQTMEPGQTITASVTVENVSGVAGDEVVQLYLHDMAASVVRPVKELKGFRKVRLEPGEKKCVSFEINEEMLKFYNAELKYVAEPGGFEAFIGPSSAECSGVRFRYTG